MTEPMTKTNRMMFDDDVLNKGALNKDAPNEAPPNEATPNKDAPNEALSVSGLTHKLKNIIESGFLDVMVQGEISAVCAFAIRAYLF